MKRTCRVRQGQRQPADWFLHEAESEWQHVWWQLSRGSSLCESSSMSHCEQSKGRYSVWDAERKLHRSKKSIITIYYKVRSMPVISIQLGNIKYELISAALVQMKLVRNTRVACWRSFLELLLFLLARRSRSRSCCWVDVELLLCNGPSPDIPPHNWECWEPAKPVWQHIWTSHPGECGLTIGLMLLTVTRTR